MKEERIRLHLYLPADLAANLDQYAQKNSISRTQAIHQAIKLMISNEIKDSNSFKILEKLDIIMALIAKNNPSL